jgi:hypothetical protein
VRKQGNFLLFNQRFVAKRTKVIRTNNKLTLLSLV